MCEECETYGRGERASADFSRRAFLAAAAAAAGGATLAMAGCKGQPKIAKPPASAPAPHPAEPAPDLGSAVFPDAAGHAIAQPSDAPVVIEPRRDWTTARPSLNDIAVMNGVHLITVHHTAWLFTTDAWKPTAGELEDIREFHAGTKPADRHWADIAYHFVVDRAGRVWQARPLAYQGAHVRGHNEHNMGIVLLGNFDLQMPTAAQLVALTGFIGFVRHLYEIPVSAVFTHGELGETRCPGKNLQAFMNRARKQWAAQIPAPAL